MNAPRLIPLFLIALPAAASASPHSVLIRASLKGESWSHTTKAEVGQQTAFGSIGRIIVNTILVQTGNVFKLNYQVEFPGGGGNLQIQSSVILNPGERLRTLECGGWTVDLALDAPAKNGPPPTWPPSGPNYRLTINAETINAGKQRCRLVQEANDTQSNIIIKKARGRFSLDTLLDRPAGSSCRLQYTLQEAQPTVRGLVDTTLRNDHDFHLTLGRKALHSSGKAELLLEGPAVAPVAAAPAATAAPSEGGGVPLLR